MARHQHILVAVDFSDDSRQIADCAIEISQAFNSRLSFIHVVEYIPVDIPDGMMTMPSPEISQQMYQLATERMSAMVADLGIQAEQFIEQGSTRREILRCAEDNSVDLIVIGSHGRSGVQLLLGSTANAVLHGAPCDVLAVRIKE